MKVTLRSKKTVQITEIEVMVDVAEVDEHCGLARTLHQVIIEKALEADLPEDLYPYFVDATVRVVDIGFIINRKCRVVIEAVKEVEEVE